MIRHNSTIISKKKKCVSCGRIDYHFSKKRCKTCATIEDTQKRVDSMDEDQESLQYLMQDLDHVFSKYIRLKYADDKGMVECFTSGKKFHWGKIQCGHFIPRSNLGTRWLEANCRPQSEYDNCFLSGNMDVFEKKLEEEKSGSVDYLRELAYQVAKPSRDELKQMIIEYRHKVRMLEFKAK